jgi:hypothetical protein
VGAVFGVQTFFESLAHMLVCIFLVTKDIKRKTSGLPWLLPMPNRRCKQTNQEQCAKESSLIWEKHEPTVCSCNLLPRANNPIPMQHPDLSITVHIHLRFYTKVLKSNLQFPRKLVTSSSFHVQLFLVSTARFMA